MLNKHKQILVGIVIGAIIFGATPALTNTLRTFIAEEASFPIVVDGAKVELDMPVVTIEGRTYIPLRALGDVLGVKVDWNDEKGQAEVLRDGDNVVQATEVEKTENYNFETIEDKEYILFSNVDDICMKKGVSATYSVLNMLIYLSDIKTSEERILTNDIRLYRLNDELYASREDFEGKILPFINE